MLACSGCETVMDKITEKVLPVSHRKLELGSRMENKGKREKIDYASSESFLIELLDEICDIHLEGYNSVAQVEKDVLPWIFIHQDDDDRPPEEDEEREYGKVYRTGQENEQLKRICYKILDYHEEDIMALLRKGLTAETNLKKHFCWDQKLGPIGDIRCNDPEAGYPDRGKHKNWKRKLKMTDDGHSHKRKKLAEARREREERDENKRQERIKKAQQKKAWLEKQERKKKKRAAKKKKKKGKS